VLGFSDLLLAGRGLAPQQREIVGHVRSAGSHLLELIADLLDLSRIEAGTLALALQPAAVAPLVAETVELVRPQAAARGIVISTHLGGSQPARARIDETRMRQVLMNLLSNAVKYNREGGRITIELHADDALTLGVSDTGLGLSVEQQRQLFTPFSRLGRENSAIEGTGIGLVIARHLVEMMGGRLECESRLGEGSTFLITLPLANGPANEQAAPPSVAVAAPDAALRDDVRGRLLVVEDNEINRLLLAMYLEHRPNVAVRFAEGVDEATRCLDEALPQIALIDLNLGARSGLELLHTLRARAHGCAVRCIALSADALPEQVEAALAAGFDDYWVKPIGLTDFLTRLDREFAAAGASAPAN
jgi:CheY-like chemotaxis protein